MDLRIVLKKWDLKDLVGRKVQPLKIDEWTYIGITHSQPLALRSNSLRISSNPSHYLPMYVLLLTIPFLPAERRKWRRSSYLNGGWSKFAIHFERKIVPTDPGEPFKSSNAAHFFFCSTSLRRLNLVYNLDSAINPLMRLELEPSCVVILLQVWTRNCMGANNGNHL